MARVTTVPKCRKPQTCGKCGDTIPVGDGYRHATPGFRGRRLVRCMKADCRFRTSDLTTSNMQGAYAAQEGCEDDIALATCLDDVEQALSAYADGLREVASLYEDASSNWGDNGNEEWDQKRDDLEAAADELDGFDWNPGDDDDWTEDDDETLTQDGIQALRDAAEEFISGVDFG
jgi:hypothetical protein